MAAFCAVLQHSKKTHCLLCRPNTVVNNKVRLYSLFQEEYSHLPRRWIPAEKRKQGTHPNQTSRGEQPPFILTLSSRNVY
jgi:hypothetical protein